MKSGKSTLESSESIAGETIGYTIALAGEDGDGSDATSYELSSDLETDLNTTDGAITATVAGSHTITANAVDPEGETVQATATLNVAAAAASALVLTLSESEVVAGESVTASVSAQDEYGNDLSADDVTFGASEGVAVDGTTLTATTAGTHTVTASQDDLSAEATWTVIAGAAAKEASGPSSLSLFLKPSIALSA